jgi:hypothetical protein
VIRLAVTFASQPNIIMAIKSRMGWAGHMARTGEKGNAYSFLVVKPEGNGPL